MAGDIEILDKKDTTAKKWGFFLAIVTKWNIF